MSELNIAVVSDIHLGHKRNDTEFIIKNLDNEFADNAETAKLDLLVLAGDVFDRLLNLSDDCVYAIDGWIFRLLKLCKKHNIVLRVLYGTPSHDREQPYRFVHLNDRAGIGADVKYVSELSIEYIASLGINVLYVPDEWEEDPQDTLVQVKELMTSRGLQTVDYAFMHGQFSFQLQSFIKAPKHDEEEYLRLVDKLIFIGHVHVFNRFKRIIAQGSFDRLSHGEEGPKGHVRATVKSKDDYNLVFVENKNARIYKTIECEDLNLQETLNKIYKGVEDIADGSFVRVLCSKDNPILTEMDQLVRYRPLITWSKQVKVVDEEEHIADVEINEEYVPITITRENIVKLVMARIQSKNPDPVVHEMANNILLEVR